MSFYLLLPLIPLFGWALGDFFIQKTVRKTSALESIFFICITFTPVVFPLIYKDLVNINITQLFSLIGLSVVNFIYAFSLFKAFKIAKLSVVESIVALELPITVGLAVTVGVEVAVGLALAVGVGVGVPSPSKGAVWASSRTCPHDVLAL